MHGETTDARARVRASAERVLAERFGGPVRLAEGEALQERDRVARMALLEAPAGAPATVVVKHVPLDEPDPPMAAGFSPPRRALLNNWAALLLLGEVAGEPELCPRIYGGDRAIGLVVMEDIGAGDGLDGLLLGGDPAAAAAGLTAYAAALGRMHAATAGREAEYDRVREALGPRGVGDDFHQYGWLAPALQAILEPLGVAAPPGAAAELAELAAELRSPGPFRVFTHGDPCPDNVRWRDGRPVIIDFDWSGYGHAMAEAVYGRIHFPTCWCVNRLPADLPDAMERAYRAALLPGCPAAGDDRAFEQLIAAGCVYWALAMGRLTPFAKALAEDRTWGIATVRQRFLLRAEVASQVAAERGHMEALGAALGAAAAEMRRRWPEADSLVLYPAFRGATP